MSGRNRDIRRKRKDKFVFTDKAILNLGLSAKYTFCLHGISIAFDLVRAIYYTNSMPFQQIKRILGSILFLGILAVMGFAGKTWTENVLAAKERSFDEKIIILQQQIAALGEQVQRLTGESSQVALSVRELQNRKDLREKSQDELLTEAVAKIAPTVVSIVISKDVPKLEVSYENPFGNDPFFKDFNFRVPVYKQKGTVNQKVGAGTGFIVTSDGYILTNRHVVADSSATYTALLSDGAQKEGKVIFRDPDNDLAILKIDGANFKIASLGNSDSLKLGQTVIAIGNALGTYNNSVSVGIISGLNRALEAHDGTRLVKLKDVLQTDAAINPGNSGGPLMTLQGEVIGINVATVIGSSNISFSIPINRAKEIVQSRL